MTWSEKPSARAHHSPACDFKHTNKICWSWDLSCIRIWPIQIYPASLVNYRALPHSMFRPITDRSIFTFKNLTLRSLARHIMKAYCCVLTRTILRNRILRNNNNALGTVAIRRAVYFKAHTLTDFNALTNFSQHASTWFTNILFSLYSF